MPHSRALRAELAQQRAEVRLERAVHALGRLIEQQHARLHEQHLRQRGTLLLPAREIKRVPLEQRRERHLLHNRVHQCVISAERRKIGAHRVRREERARVLRHGGDAVAQGLERALLFPVQIHAAAIQPQLPRKHAERRRLAAAVAAGERVELARAQRE